MRFYLAYSETDQISYTACKKLEVKPETDRYKLELLDEETLRKELACERELLENKRI